MRYESVIEVAYLVCFLNFFACFIQKSYFSTSDFGVGGETDMGTYMRFGEGADNRIRIG